MDEKGSFSFINFGKSGKKEHISHNQQEEDRENRRRASILAAREIREKLAEKDVEVSNVIIERNTSGSMQGTLYVTKPGTETGFSLTWSFEPLPDGNAKVILDPAFDSSDKAIHDFVKIHEEQLVNQLLEHLPV